MELTLDGADINLKGDGENTLLGYGYRDASNNKCFKEVVLGGRISAEQVHRIATNLEGGEFFIPGQVGLADLQGEFVAGAGWDEDDDHPFHTITDIAYTNAAAGDVTVDQMMATWPDADAWDGIAAQERLEETLPQVARI